MKLACFKASKVELVENLKFHAMGNSGKKNCSSLEWQNEFQNFPWNGSLKKCLEIIAMLLFQEFQSVLGNLEVLRAPSISKICSLSWDSQGFLSIWCRARNQDPARAGSPREVYMEGLPQSPYPGNPGVSSSPPGTLPMFCMEVCQKQYISMQHFGFNRSSFSDENLFCWKICDQLYT